MELIIIFILAFSFLMLLFSITCAIIFIDNYENLWIDPKPKKKYSITAIIPAYNEEESIQKTVMSVYNQNYPKELVEIIVVNDGSTDNTRKICEIMEKEGIIKLINKKNTGKASSVNAAISKAKGELIFLLDADSFAAKNCFNHLIGYFNNPKVAASLSSIKSSRNESFFEKMQWIEYSMSTIFRKVQSLFNAMYVAPGPGSMYRKIVLKKIGGFNEETLTEDMEMALKLHNNDYKIEYCLNSIIWTKTPSFLLGVLKQRKRWCAGYIEDSINYKNFLLNPKKGALSALLSFNMFSILSILFLLSYSAFNFVIDLFKELDFLRMIDFNINFENMKLFQLYYTINFDSVFFAIIAIFSSVLIYISLKSSNEKVKKKSFIPLCAGYAFIYSALSSAFWAAGIFHKIFLRKKGEKWYG